MKYELGMELRDIITGFRGIVVGRTEYLTGCNHYGLAPRKLLDTGKPQEWEWIDESRLVATGKVLDGYESPRTSGPEHNAPQM
jgi:hypothetical protein